MTKMAASRPSMRGYSSIWLLALLLVSFLVVATVLMMTMTPMPMHHVSGPQMAEHDHDHHEVHASPKKAVPAKAAVQQQRRQDETHDIAVKVAAAPKATAAPKVVVRDPIAEVSDPKLKADLKAMGAKATKWDLEKDIVAKDGCPFTGPKSGFLGGCSLDCKVVNSLQVAIDLCAEQTDCGGVITTPVSDYELRGWSVTHPSRTHEVSWSKQRSKKCKVDLENAPIEPYPFWEPPAGVDLDSIGTLHKGLPTIFISIAAYRDSMCHQTIERALNYATHPGRLRFGVVDQTVPGDTPCMPSEEECKSKPNSIVCKFKDHVLVDVVPAQQAKGPTFGRHRADRMYRGEYYVLQIDAHMYFINDWDEEVIRQFKGANNEYAMISTYPSESKHNLHKGRSNVHTTPAICKSDFLGDGLIRHGAAGEFSPEGIPVGEYEPVLMAWWAAGLSFARGHRVVRVPYDCCTPMTFNGEEFSMAVRMWTAGYDMYTFRRAVAMHPYRRHKDRPALFWENGNRFPMAAEQAAARLQEMFGLERTQDIQFDRTDMERYGIRKKRPLSKFWKVWGIDTRARTVKDLCGPVQSGQVHKYLTQYLRADKKGIDYTKVPDRLPW